MQRLARYFRAQTMAFLDKSHFQEVSLVAQMVKNLSATQETRLQSLGQEDPLENGMATHSSILAWRIPWTEEPGGFQSMGHKESDMTKQLTLSLFQLTE